MEVGGYSNGYAPETLSALALKAKFYGVNEVVIESNFGDGMFLQLLKPVLNKTHPCATSEVNNRTQKEQRIIDTLEPVMMQHRLIINTAVIMEDYGVYEGNPAYSLFYQMTRLCNERGALAHDDRLDAVSMAVAHWKEVLDRDADTGIEEHLEEQLEAWSDPDRGITYIPDMGKQQLSTGHYHLKNLAPYRS